MSTTSWPPHVLEAAEALELAQHDPGDRSWLRTVDGRLDIEYEKAAYIVLASVHHDALVADNERLRESGVIEQAQSLVTMLTCPWYAKTGEQQCVSGCRDEPACETGGPWMDQIVEVLRAVADLGIDPQEEAT